MLFPHIIVWFYIIFMISNWNSDNKSWKFLENLSFYQNFQFLGTATLHFIWLNFDLEQNWFHQNIPQGFL